MAPNATTRVKFIEKEQIKFLQFPKEDVLYQMKDKVNRIVSLRRALALGNLEREKVKIIFVDNEGFKKVETTIWGFTDKEVILKQGTIIPVARVYNVV